MKPSFVSSLIGSSMRYKFKVGDRVRLYRRDAYCTLDKGDNGIITNKVGDWIVIRVVTKTFIVRYDTVHVSWLAHVKE